MKTTEAVKSLRVALGDTQQSFAHRLGLAISTAVRYETNRPPTGTALLELMKLADAHGLEDLATKFQEAISEELRFPVRRLSPLRGQEEDFDALFTILNLGGFEKEREAWKKLSAKAKAANLGKDHRAMVNFGLVDHVNKHVDAGESVDAIVASLPHTSPDLVRMLAGNRREMNRLGAKTESKS